MNAKSQCHGNNHIRSYSMKEVKEGVLSEGSPKISDSKVTPVF